MLRGCGHGEAPALCVPQRARAMTPPPSASSSARSTCASPPSQSSPAHIRALSEPCAAGVVLRTRPTTSCASCSVPTTRHTMAELRDAWGDRARLEPRSPARSFRQPPRMGAATHAPTLQPRAAGEILAARRDRGLMAEVTLIDGVNDGAKHAEQLHALLAPCRVRRAPAPTRTATPFIQLQPQPRYPGKTRINLIPYNANAGLGAAGRLFLPSPPAAVRLPSEAHHLGVICTVRVRQGGTRRSRRHAA